MKKFTIGYGDGEEHGAPDRDKFEFGCGWGYWYGDGVNDFRRSDGCFYDKLTFYEGFDIYPRPMIIINKKKYEKK